jgi:two-component system phosphate regulon sensor histidine kinase PhoR
LRLALAGERVTGTEGGDELGLALRGYAPVLQSGTVVGAVMIADPFDQRLLGRLVGQLGSPGELEVATERVREADDCEPPAGANATCTLGLRSPGGSQVAALRLNVSLSEIDQARTSAQQAVWAAGAVVVLLGAIVAWLLARSLTGPLARLTRVADRIADGDYQQPVPPAGADEIGLLARALEMMRGRVAASTGALREERDVLDAVLESTGDGILMVDGSGATAVANGAWSRLLGGRGLAAAAELRRTETGDPFLEVAHAWLADALRVGVADFESPAPYRRVRCYSAPVRHRDGTPLGRIFVVRDITRESEAERMRSALVSTVSHELRSPLAAITGYTRTILDGGPWDAPTQREFLEIVATSADKLANLVDSLLDAAKLEAGVLILEPEPVRVERIAEQVVAQRRRLAPDHALQVEVEPDVPLVEADPLRVEQVLVNLVENAIRYSPRGGPVRVTVGRSQRGVLVGVSDRGVGVAPDVAERLFERFYRVDNALARETKGIGLGLYICRSLVRAHGGEIGLRSQPGAGSTFWFELPVVAEQEPAAERQAAWAADGVRV